jgi:hypothetical protein
VTDQPLDRGEKRPGRNFGEKRPLVVNRADFGGMSSATEPDKKESPAAAGTDATSDGNAVATVIVNDPASVEPPPKPPAKPKPSPLAEETAPSLLKLSKQAEVGAKAKGYIGPLALVRRYWPDALFWVLSALLVAWIAWDSIAVRLVTYMGGADYWEHTATLRALIEHPFSPRNPQVLSPEPSPRFGPHYVIVALVARALGWNAMDAMAFAGTLNAALFVLGIYAFFGTYFRDRRAPLYGLIVMFGSWWSAWNFSNVYQLSIFFGVAGYPSSATLAITMLGFALAVKALRAPKVSPWHLGGLVLIWAYALITHQLTAMLSLSGCVILAAVEPKVSLKRRLWVGGTVLGACLVATAWPYFPVWQVIAGGKGEEAGWIGRSVADAAKGGEEYRLHYFYRTSRILQTLGLALIGIPISLWSLFTKRRFIGLGALSMAAPFIGNAFVPLPLGHRFILLTVFYLQVAVVWVLVGASPRMTTTPRTWAERLTGYVGSLLVAVTLGLSAYINIEDSWREFSKALARAQDSRSPFVRYAERVGEIAGPDAVVLGDPMLTWPVSTFGPRVVALNHENPLVEDRTARLQAVDVFLNGRTSDAERLRIIDHFQVTHILVKDKQERQISDFLDKHAGKRTKLPAGHRLYELE